MKKTFLLSIVVVFVCLSQSSMSDGPNPHIDLLPQVQAISEKGGETFMLDSAWTIEYETSALDQNESAMKRSYLFCAKELKEQLGTKGIHLSIQRRDSSASNEKKKIILGDLNSKSLQPLYKAADIRDGLLPYSKNDPRWGEGYILSIAGGMNQTVIIAAREPKGVFYGIQTFLKLLDRKALNPVTIIDYPDMKWRGAYIDFDWHNPPHGYTSCLSKKMVDNVIAEVKRMARLKLNTIVFRGVCFYNLDQHNKSLLKEVFDISRDYFLTPIPTLQSKFEGFSTVVGTRCRPLVSLRDAEGVRISNEEFYFDDHGFAVSRNEFAKDYITNGSFEEENEGGNSIKWWKVINGEEGEWSRVAVLPPLSHLGRYAMRLKSRSRSDFKEIALIPNNGKPIEVSPNSYFELLFWAKKDQAFNTGLRVSIRQYGSFGTPINSSSYGEDLTLSNQWKGYHVPIFVPNNGKGLQIVFKQSPIGDARGDISIDKIKLYRLNGNLMNVIRGSGSEVEIRAKDGQFLFKEGIDYTIEEGKFNADFRFYPDNASRTKIKLTPNSGISRDSTVKISYDCALMNPEMEGTRYCPSNPGTYTIYKDLFENLLYLDPLFINIEADEHLGGYNRDGRCLRRNMDNACIFSQFINSLNSILKEDGGVEVLPGTIVKGLGRKQTRLIMWDDMVNPWHNGGNRYYQVRWGGMVGETSLALTARKDGASLNCKPISNDIIIASWWYSSEKATKIEKVGYYEGLGFDYFGCSWDNEKNAKLWSQSLSGKRALGLMNTTWGGRKKGIAPTAAYSWKIADKK